MNSKIGLILIILSYIFFLISLWPIALPLCIIGTYILFKLARQYEINQKNEQ